MQAQNHQVCPCELSRPSRRITQMHKYCRRRDRTARNIVQRVNFRRNVSDINRCPINFKYPHATTSAPIIADECCQSRAAKAPCDRLELSLRNWNCSRHLSEARSNMTQTMSRNLRNVSTREQTSRYLERLALFKRL